MFPRRASTMFRHSKAARSLRNERSGWEAGKRFNGGSTRASLDDPPKKYLRAINVAAGRIAWELPQFGPGTTRGGVLAAAGCALFFCADGNKTAAIDSATGKLLWLFRANHCWRASPMTYVFDGKQHVAVASGSNIICVHGAGWGKVRENLPAAARICHNAARAAISNCIVAETSLLCR